MTDQPKFELKNKPYIPTRKRPITITEDIPVYVPTTKRTILPLYEKDIFKQDLQQILQWTDHESYEILLDKTEIVHRQINSILTNKNHIVILIEDEDGNRYGGYINTFIYDVFKRVPDSQSFLFQLASHGESKYEKYPIKQGTNEEGYQISDMAFIKLLPQWNQILFQFGEGDLYLYREKNEWHVGREYDWYICRESHSFCYPTTYEQEIAERPITKFKHLWIIHLSHRKTNEENKIYISNIPTRLRTEIIRDRISEEVGKENIKEIHVNKDERETCVVYLSMKTRELAKQAIKKLNTIQMGDQPIKATWMYSDGPVARYKKNNLYIYLPDGKRLRPKERTFITYFEQFGEVLDMRFFGIYGFVLYKNTEDAEQVLQLNGTETPELGLLVISKSMS